MNSLMITPSPLAESGSSVAVIAVRIVRNEIALRAAVFFKSVYPVDLRLKDPGLVKRTTSDPLCALVNFPELPENHLITRFSGKP